MRKLLVVVVLMSIAGVAFAAKPMFFRARLSGDQEVPPTTSTAKGSATCTWTETALTYRVRVTGLDSITAAHIHLGVKGQSGPVVATLLSAPSRKSTGVIAKGTIHRSELAGPFAGMSVRRLVQAIRADSAYVNVHTASHPDGEIRGQLGPR